MNTKTLKLQEAEGAEMTVDASADNKKLEDATKAAAGLAAGGAVAYAAYEGYQYVKGKADDATADTTVDAESDAVHEAIADLTADAPVVEAAPVEAAASVHPLHTAPATHDDVVTPAHVNPNEVADEVIVPDMVDAVDVAASNDDLMFDAGEVSQVYNVNGELETMACINIDGTDMVLVDVNGDNVFDVVRDDVFGDVDLGIVSTVSDIEMHQAEQAGDLGYLAATDHEAMPDGDSFENDIIDPSLLG